VLQSGAWPVKGVELGADLDLAGLPPGTTPPAGLPPPLGLNSSAAATTLPSERSAAACGEVLCGRMGPVAALPFATAAALPGSPAASSAVLDLRNAASLVMLRPGARVRLRNVTLINT
jgi:hypothetical protein